MNRIKIDLALNELLTKLERNDILRLAFGDKKICIGKSEHSLIAFQEACPHMGVSLGGAKITPFKEVVCPWHGYRFSLLDGKESENRCKHLKLYKLEIVKEEIYIQIT